MTMKPTAILTAALLCVLSPLSFAKPLKVFILAGQSNMQGHADISTFDYVGKDRLTAPILAAMRDAEGKPRVCENVWISSLGCGGNQYSDMLVKTGKLTAGFGASDGKIGPEFTFGIYTEKMLKEPAHRFPSAQCRTLQAAQGGSRRVGPTSPGRSRSSQTRGPEKMAGRKGCCLGRLLPGDD
jgi:hypothetical protein